MATQDEINEGIARFQAELDATAPKIAEALGMETEETSWREDVGNAVIIPCSCCGKQLRVHPDTISRPRTVRTTSGETIVKQPVNASAIRCASCGKN